MRARSLVLLLVLGGCSANSGGPSATGPVTGGPARGSAAAPLGPSAGAPATSEAASAAGTRAAPVLKVTLADVGLESASLDRTADPCVDFYQFACGGWLQHNPIPPDRARWARFSALDEQNTGVLKTLLDEAAAATSADASTKKLGDFYAACMDDAAVERAGLGPIQSLLARTTKVTNAKSWLAAVTALHELGIWVVWSEHAMADLKDSRTNVTYLESAGLGLPDRDYYLKPELEAQRAAYRVHVAKLLVLAGTPAAKADAAADAVLAIETELARHTRTMTEKRDIEGGYHPSDLRRLARTVRSIDWKAYFRAMGYTPSKKLVISSPKYFAQLDAIRAKFAPAQWASYLTYHLVQSLAFQLPKAFDDQAFELERVVTGVEQRPERSKRCVEATQQSLGELLGREYASRYFPGASKQTASELVGAILAAMRAEIARLDWMSDATKVIAQQKLDRIERMVGYPESWRRYDFDVRRDDFAGNLLRARAFETRRVLARSGKPVDRAEWQMNVFDVNAYYEPTANSTALPAGILQPPFFGKDRSLAANLGGIGMVIGHELTHGFDDQGAQFDADGNLADWWQPADKAKFTAKGACVADQYATFEAMPKGFVNGQLTLGENIADLGGVKMAFNAYRALRENATERYVADGFTEDQQFFLAVAQAWCSQDRPAEIQRRLSTDVHAPPKFRVYGALRNLPDFAEAFQCAPGTPMNPAERCSVW